ncbi:ABC transporter substrate-binding protein [Rhodobacterales bacterium]|nr:ABC transporter substrate-binding protein [Rhodobacterales bacterium]
MKTISAISRRLCATLVLGLSFLPAAAHAEPEALPSPVTLNVGYQKVGHLSPMTMVVEPLEKLGLKVELVEFARYADTRTALLAGSLDIATVGPADLAIALSNGSDTVVGLMGVGSSAKYVIGRKGVELNSWEDLAGKTVAIAPGSAVWFQLAATLVEQEIPYDSFTAVNIQGGGANFDQALKNGEVDAIVTWEPFESIPVIEGYGYFAKNLEYSQSEAVGAELGMMVASREAVETKRDAVVRFVWAYLEAQKKLASDNELFAQAYSDLTGLPLDVATEAAKPISLGSVVTPEQIKRQAKAFAELGVIQKDVSGEIAENWDESIVTDAKTF